MKEMGILWGKMTPGDKEKYSNKAKGIKVESPAGLLPLPLTLYIYIFLSLPLSLPPFLSPAHAQHQILSMFHLLLL